MKANERDSRTEQERFIDRMLKEILGGQRNPGDRLPTESELAAQYDLRKTNFFAPRLRAACRCAKIR